MMRLYLDHHSVDANTLYLLLTLADHTALDLCLGLHHGGPGTSTRNGMLWRLLPILDPLVDVVLIRDLDSRLTRREAGAVGEWLASSKAVHVMRDHPSHSWPMLGGMWGARMEGEREMLGGLTRRLLGEVVARVWVYLADQTQLQRVVWPAVQVPHPTTPHLTTPHHTTPHHTAPHLTTPQHLALVHASHHCHLEGGTVHPFPSRRPEGQDNWVGAVVGRTGELTAPCPAACRPSNHRYVGSWKMTNYPFNRSIAMVVVAPASSDVYIY